MIGSAVNHGGEVEGAGMADQKVVARGDHVFHDCAAHERAVHERVLAREQEFNRRYQEVVEALPEWINVSGVPVRVRQMRRGALIGRLRIRFHGDEVDDEFYVGPMQAEVDGIEVVSWVAPAAKILLARRYAGGGLKVRRRFDTEGCEVVDFYDEWFVDPIDPPAFRTPEPEPVDVVRPEASTPESPRAGETLEKKLKKPRTDLHSKLATLQGDQFDLVTADPGVSMVVQGYAGTGKTIVATHRAAWLTHPEHDRRLAWVALIGPTSTWSAHIRPAVEELAIPGAVVIRSVSEVFAELIGLADRVGASSDAGPIGASSDAGSDGTVPGASPDVIHATSSWLAATAEAVVDKQRSVNPELTRAQAYAALVRTATAVVPPKDRAKVDKADFLAWLGALPRTYEDALPDPTLRPLLAWLTVLLRDPEPYDHVVIDEAQDLRPLEWRVLARLNAGQWTLVGDTSQRRTSHTPKGWRQVIALLGGGQWQQEKLTRGYRSTQAIIDFAAELQPGAKRTSSVLGQGQPPILVDARKSGRDLAELALEQAITLGDRHPDGTIAVITPFTARIGAYAADHGWTATEGHRWEGSSGHRFVLLTSPEARGLEFDAVVVVEPAAFEVLSGDNGPLYTALTRANLELVVVHEKSLPAAIQFYLRTHPTAD